MVKYGSSNGFCSCFVKAKGGFMLQKDSEFMEICSLVLKYLQHIKRPFALFYVFMYLLVYNSNHGPPEAGHFLRANDLSGLETQSFMLRPLISPPAFNLFNL